MTSSEDQEQPLEAAKGHSWSVTLPRTWKFRDSTEWLQRWYERLGYEIERDAGYEIVMEKRNKK